MAVDQKPDTYTPEAISWLQCQLRWEQTFERLRSPEAGVVRQDLDQAA
jgi:hypothetical protein